MVRVAESTVEQAALAWLKSLGWQVKHGPEIAPGTLEAEREDFGQVVLSQRLRDAPLPKLLAVEIHTEETEKFVGEGS